MTCSDKSLSRSSLALGQVEKKNESMCVTRRATVGLASPAIRALAAYLVQQNKDQVKTRQEGGAHL